MRRLVHCTLAVLSVAACSCSTSTGARSDASGHGHKTQELLGVPAVFVALPDDRGVSFGCAFVYDQRHLLLTPHQVREPSGTIIVSGQVMEYQVRHEVRGMTGASGWVFITLDHDVVPNSQFEIEFDFKGKIPEGSSIFVTWYPQTIESLVFPLEYHLEELNFTDLRVSEVRVLRRPSHVANDERLDEFLLFQPALDGGASGAPAFRWDAHAGRWLLIGIHAGVMEFEPHDTRQRAPEPIGLLRRPHELVYETDDGMTPP